MQQGNEQQQIIVREVQPAPVVQQEVDPLAIIQKRNKMLEAVLTYALQATRSEQWVDQQGKPFPTAAAAEVMARRCAVRIEVLETTKKHSADDRGPFYIYEVKIRASLPGAWDSIEAIGTCSSRDQFLGTETAKGRELSEIDEGNISKAAYSNGIVNAVTRLLGVRGMTWERLAELGISRDGAAKVEYQSGSRGGGGNKGNGPDPEIKWGKSKGKKVSELDEKETCFYLEKAEEDVAKHDEKWHKLNVGRRDALAAHLEKLNGSKTGEAAPAGEKKPASRQGKIWAEIQAQGLDPKGFVERTLGAAKGWNNWTAEDMDHLEESLKAEKEMAKEPGSGG